MLTAASAMGLPPSAAMTRPARAPPALRGHGGDGRHEGQNERAEPRAGGAGHGGPRVASVWGGIAAGSPERERPGGTAPIYGPERPECQGNRPTRASSGGTVCVAHDLLTSPTR